MSRKNVKWRNGSILPEHARALETFHLPKEIATFIPPTVGTHQINHRFTVTIQGSMAIRQSYEEMVPIGLDMRLAFATAMNHIPKEQWETVWNAIANAMENPLAFNQIADRIIDEAETHIPNAQVKIPQSKRGPTLWAKDTKINVEVEELE